MITDEELKVEGVRALFAALGNVQAERFVSLMTKAAFDYTKWQRGLWAEKPIDEISREAMQLRSFHETTNNQSNRDKQSLPNKPMDQIR